MPLSFVKEKQLCCENKCVNVFKEIQLCCENSFCVICLKRNNFCCENSSYYLVKEWFYSANIGGIIDDYLLEANCAIFVYLINGEWNHEL